MSTEHARASEFDPRGRPEDAASAIESRMKSEGVIRVMRRGVVKWFNESKGYGFIEQETGPDVFVHYSSIKMNGFRTLKPGQAVEFEVTTGPKGLHAVEVYSV